MELGCLPLTTADFSELPLVCHHNPRTAALPSLIHTDYPPMWSEHDSGGNNKSDIILLWHAILFLGLRFCHPLFFVLLGIMVDYAAFSCKEIRFIIINQTLLSRWDD
jgi:hypothetical protein